MMDRLPLPSPRKDLSAREAYLIYYSERLDQITSRNGDFLFCRSCGAGVSPAPGRRDACTTIREHATGPWMKTIDILFDESQLTIEDIAERALLTPERVEAIAVARWTPSPAERQKIAAAFGVPVDEITWVHTKQPPTTRYH